jgi:hypothetical protein
MADEVVLLNKDPKLAHDVLPKQAFTRPLSIANSAPAVAPAATDGPVPASAPAAAPASAGSTHR